MRIRTWLAAAVTAVLLAIPVQAFAAQDTDTQAPTWDGATWTQEVLPPVAEPATDESPQEATVVTRIILADIDMNRKVISELAISDAKGFADVCEAAKKALSK